MVRKLEWHRTYVEAEINLLYSNSLMAYLAVADAFVKSNTTLSSPIAANTLIIDAAAQVLTTQRCDLVDETLNNSKVEVDISILRISHTLPDQNKGFVCNCNEHRTLQCSWQQTRSEATTDWYLWLGFQGHDIFRSQIAQVLF